MYREICWLSKNFFGTDLLNSSLPQTLPKKLYKTCKSYNQQDIELDAGFYGSSNAPALTRAGVAGYRKPIMTRGAKNRGEATPVEERCETPHGIGAISPTPTCTAPILRGTMRCRVPLSKRARFASVPGAFSAGYFLFWLLPLAV